MEKMEKDGKDLEHDGKDLEHDGKDVGTRCTHLAPTVPSPVVRPTTVDAASGGGHVEQIQLGSSKKSREMSILTC